MELQLRGAAVAHDLDVTPEHPLRVSGAEGFHGRFFGGKSSGKMDHGRAAPLAIRNFAGREDAVQKAIAVAANRGRDAVDLCDVQSQPDDSRHATTSA